MLYNYSGVCLNGLFTGDQVAPKMVAWRIKKSSEHPA